MKKVLFVIYSMKYGGAERSLVNLLQELPEDKYEVDLLLFQKKGDFLLQIPGWVRVLETPEDIERLYAPLNETKLRGYTKLMGTACSRLARKKPKSRTAYRWRNFYSRKICALEKHYDVAVAYAGSENLYFIHDKVRADKKLVWIHNDYRTAGYSKVDDLPYFENMDAIVSVSKECVDVLKEEFPQYQNRIHYVENITSSKAIRKQAGMSIPREYQNPDTSILSVGRLHPQKGFDMAVEAASILKKDGLNFCWYIIGDGPLCETLKQQIKDCGVEDCFVLLGTRNNPYPYIKNCAFIVQPSRYEGKSVVLDEAKILAAPIVATAYPTVRDQVIEGKEGLVTPMTSQGIADGVRKMMLHGDLRRTVQGYLAQQEYGNQTEVVKYMQLLDM